MSGLTPRPPTVLDATVLSNFAYLDRVSRLQILSRPVVPPAVLDEIVTGAESHAFLSNAESALSETIPVVELDPESRELRAELTGTLDLGEAEALAVAETRTGLLVTDDGAARDLARARDVPVTGSIGVLIELIETGSIEESAGEEWLKRLIDEAGYRAPSRDLDEYR